MKRLVVCCDGTWQELKTEYPSNVVKFAQAVTSVAGDKVPQIVFYDEGVGTEAKSTKLFGGAFGWGLDKNILDCYRFLSLNYVPGDEIYLLGYSRGAYTVRSLAGFIYNSGLVKRQYLRAIPRAFEIYRDRNIHPDDKEAQLFRKQFGERVNITLLGCWDTVGALGVPDQVAFLPIDDWVNEKYQFHDTKLSAIIQNALHAVAIDERRKAFDATLMTKSSSAVHLNLKQVWFCGDHGCIGGGYKTKSGLSDITLLWMIDEIRRSGLKLELDVQMIPDGVNPRHDLAFDNDIGALYKLTGAIDREIVGSFEDVHASVKKRWKSDPHYRPAKLAEKFGAALDK
jgi:uncharacterized protein (DUF2235 family)